MSVKLKPNYKNINSDQDFKCLVGNEKEVGFGSKSVLQEIIEQHIDNMCKKLCFDSCNKFQCTLNKNWGQAPKDAPLCEWGNGTYDWMLGELTNIQTQNLLKQRKIYAVENYFRKIVTSIPFWERYKNWRFQRRIRVPEYIKSIDIDACKVFWLLYDQHPVENIANKLSRAECDTRSLVNRIIKVLHERKKSYLLEKNTEFPLSNFTEGEDQEIWYAEGSCAHKAELELRELVLKEYQRLTWQEQYILDVMVIDNLSAKAVLKTLQESAISLDDKTSSNDLNIQSIYYFLRKTLIKLKKNSSLVKEDCYDN